MSFIFGVGGAPKSLPRGVLGGFEPVVKYGVKPLTSGRYMLHVKKHR